MRQLQRHQFEEQMRKLEQEHAKEERELLGVPLGMHHIAVSAPTTPPRVPSVVHSEHGQQSSGRTLDSAVAQERFNAHLLASAQIASQTAILPQALQAMVDKEAKRKSVTYAPTTNDLPAAPTPALSSKVLRAMLVPNLCQPVAEALLAPEIPTNSFTGYQV
jgi:hypothetical protein